MMSKHAAMPELDLGQLLLSVVAAVLLWLVASPALLRSLRLRYPHVAALLAPWAAGRVLALARSAYRRVAAPATSRRSSLAPAPTSSSPRRRAASTLNLAGAAGLETPQQSGVKGEVTRACFAALRDMLAPMPAATPSGVQWDAIFERETEGLTYSAWRHVKPCGACEYLSVTVFEGTTPEEVNSFFNDDAFRLTWDEMFVGFEVLESDAATGAEVVRWVRRFPLMVMPRDYVFSRRSFVDGGDLYTVSRACEHSSCPPKQRCRRVVDFASSWRLRPVVGRDGQAATEVVLLHWEDQGIQHDLAKIAIRRGMWGCVLGMHKGLQAYVTRRRERLKARSKSARGNGNGGGGGARNAAGEVGAAAKPIAAFLKTALMLIGGVVVARAAAGGAVKVVRGVQRRRKASHADNAKGEARAQLAVAPAAKS